MRPPQVNGEPDLVIYDDPIEGSWYGPDKVAHLLVVPAVTGWAHIFWPGAPAVLLWLISTVLCLSWEISNYWMVLRGRTGVSILDGLAFLAGSILAGGLLWLAQ